MEPTWQSVTASQRVPRGPAGGRLRVVSMTTQSWWRPHGTRARAWQAASSPQLTMRAATVWLIKGQWGRGENLCFRFGSTKYLKIRNTEANWANREIPWQLMWKCPHHGFVKRLLTHQHCAHRSRNQNWVVNPEWKQQNPGSGWASNHADSKKGEGGVNVRDKTCSKNWDTEKNKIAVSLGISLPLESGQLESW